MKSPRILLIGLFISIAAGLVCDYFYSVSPQRVINTSHFQEQLIAREQLAEATMKSIEQIIRASNTDSLIHYPFANNDISYYVFEQEELVFWSDNQLDISHITLHDSSEWHHVELPNAHCVSNLNAFGSTKILALIKIKNNYPYENEDLVNTFSDVFDTNKEVQILQGKKTDKNAVFCSQQEYLFTLAQPTMPVYNNAWENASMTAYAVAFLLFFLLYANAPLLLRKRRFIFSWFASVVSVVGAFVGLCLYFNLPESLFLNHSFTSFQYASNPILSSIVHLTVATAFVLSSIYLFYKHCRTGNSGVGKLIGKVSFTLFFVLFYYILSGLIYHSSIQLSILHFKDFTFIGLWAHFIIFLWGIALVLLFFKTHSKAKLATEKKQAFITECLLSLTLGIICFVVWGSDAWLITAFYTALWLVFYLSFFFKKHKSLYLWAVLWVLVFASFVVWNSLSITHNNKNEKYKVLAQNIFINGNIENDRMAEILLEELDVDILNDKKIGKLLANADSLIVANEYLNKTYLRGFWNKYEMRLNVANRYSALWDEYFSFIAKSGLRLKSTHFYSVPPSENKLSYIGAFPVNNQNADSAYFYMEFYPRRQFKSYSFPNLLIASSADIQSQLDISLAKYDKGKLVYASADADYPATNEWIPKSESDFTSSIFNERLHYAYTPNAQTVIVISEKQTRAPLTYFIYFLYTYLAFLALSWCVIWLFAVLGNKNPYQLGLTTKFQYAFIILLIISFLGIFYVSVNFIKNKYTDEQIANLESKKKYIQKALQDLYYWNQKLSADNTQALNFDLQDLSYTYQTDIHVYDNLGELIGSSQPTIFNKSLISNRMSPTPYFTANANINQYEHIGKLNYLTAYADLYNGDYLQIGYIAVPQFLSQDEIQSEIQSFIAVIIHIYFIIIVLAIFLTLFIGKQLSAPLNMLENKLKEMRLGRRNEKIDYTLNDEIGQLVLQYNRTIDQLEQSAKLLAQSERESAWKSMARQVAHEINNPLTPMKLTIQQLQRTKKMDSDQFDAYFEKSSGMLIEQIDNLSRIAGTFSNFARMPEAKFDRVDLAAKLYSVVQLFMNNNENVRIKYTGKKKDIFVFADPEQLVQVFNNLLKNALQAIPADKLGEIKVSIDGKSERVIVNVSDNGSGIDSDIHDKLFAPNFTTKSTGMGLGLAISKNIIELSGGTISFTTLPNEGTTFTISLPKES